MCNGRTQKSSTKTPLTKGDVLANGPRGALVKQATLRCAMLSVPSLQGLLAWPSTHVGNRAPSAGEEVRTVYHADEESGSECSGVRGHRLHTL